MIGQDRLVVRNDTSPSPGRGGYDEGYAQCDRFWGVEPGSLVRRWLPENPLEGRRILDVGCGDGKNALWLAARGADVIGLDVSRLAVGRATEQDGAGRVSWLVADAGALPFTRAPHFDVIVVYGLLHCLANEGAVHAVIDALQSLTKPGGLHLTVAFNERDQDLDRAHPGFRPTLLEHDEYLRAYASWQVLEATDTLLHESHPHNGVAHHHSMTRIVARRPS